MSIFLAHDKCKQQQMSLTYATTLSFPLIKLIVSFKNQTHIVILPSEQSTAMTEVNELSTAMTEVNEQRTVVTEVNEQSTAMPEVNEVLFDVSLSDDYMPDETEGRCLRREDSTRSQISFGE